MLLLLTFAAPASAQSFASPVNGRVITQNYATLGLVVADEYHTGIDMTSSSGDRTVRAAASGRVRRVPLGTFANSNHGMGNVVLIEHSNGLHTLYAHLATIAVANGQTVSRGATIGTYGTTGCGSCGAHLHFELRFWGELGNLDDDAGPEWGYTPAHPNLSGYLNPFPYVEYTVGDFAPRPVRSSSTQTVRTGPGTDYVSQVTTVQSGQVFYAQAERGGWYLIHVPSAAGPGTGWIQATPTTARRAVVTDDSRGVTGINVRASAGSSGAVRSAVWDDLVLPVLEQSPAGGGCSQPWYRVPLAGNAAGGSGWVCGLYLDVDVATPGDDGPAAPSGLVIAAVSPTPLRNSGSVSFALPSGGAVILTAVDALGRRVGVLADSAYPAGLHTVRWDTGSLPSGMYVLVLEAGGARASVRAFVAR